jgi:hypothetical protein
MHLVHLKQPAHRLTPTTLRWSTLSADAKRVGRKGKYKNPLSACGERVVDPLVSGYDRVSLRSRIQYTSMK